MSPTNFGALPNTKPLPSGRGQLKLGNFNGVGWTYPGSGQQPLYDAQGAVPMQVALTPEYPCLWLVTFQTIFMILDAAWITWEVAIRCEPTDLDGFYEFHSYPISHAHIGWNTRTIQTMFRLQAGTPYTATARHHWMNGSGYHYCDWIYHRIFGVQLGEAAV